MLDKASATWSKYAESFDLMENWLDQQDRLASENSYEQFDFNLNGYQRYQRVHAQFNESANFLLLISDPSSTAPLIKEKLIYLNKRWKSVQDRLKQSADAEQMVRYYECEQSLHMIGERLNKIESLVQKACKFSPSSLNKYSDELQKALNDIEALDANVKLLSKLSSRVDLKKSATTSLMIKLVDGIRSCESRLEALRRTVGEHMKTLRRSLAEWPTSAEAALAAVEDWLADGECLLKADAEHLSYEQIVKLVDKEKKHFGDLVYQKSVVDSKLKQLDSIKSIAGSAINLDYSEITARLFRLSDLIEVRIIKK